MNNVIQQPRVSTMTVEISVIKIGNNKMTLSVFDQLYTGKPYDEYFKIIYPIWGKVNRSGDDYVIFQINNELRKIKIPRELDLYDFEESLRKSTTNSSGFGFYLRSANVRFKDWIKEPGNYYFSDVHLKFMDSLTDVDKNIIMDEYNQTSDKIKSFNDMIDKLRSSNQLFIAV